MESFERPKREKPLQMSFMLMAAIISLRQLIARFHSMLNSLPFSCCCMFSHFPSFLAGVCSMDTAGRYLPAWYVQSQYCGLRLSPWKLTLTAVIRVCLCVCCVCVWVYWGMTNVELCCSDCCIIRFSVSSVMTLTRPNCSFINDHWCDTRQNDYCRCIS